MKSLKLSFIALAILNLAACTSSRGHYDMQYEPYQYEDTRYYQPQGDLYMEYDGYYSDNYGNQNYHDAQSNGRPTPPPVRRQVTAKQHDTRWVSSQDPSYYTIELAKGAKASHVAKKLNQAPRDNRTAEIKSYGNGGTQYKGLYGSYSTYEEASRALNALPAAIRQGAKVRQWQSIQGNMTY